MSLSRRAVPRARLPCSQARRTEESPPRACARRSLRLPTSLSPADTVTSISRSDPLSVPRRDRGEPRISIARPGRKGGRAVIETCPGQIRRHANQTWGTSTVDDTSWNDLSMGPDSPAGRRTGRALNENPAREILELHTLGVDGGYTQSDVIEFAKTPTGWTHGGMVPPGRTVPISGDFVFRNAMHEPDVCSTPQFEMCAHLDGAEILSVRCRNQCHAPEGPSTVQKRSGGCGSGQRLRGVPD